MKKVLIILVLLSSGISNAQEVTYSLVDMAVRLIQSSTITPSGKVFMASYLETLSEQDVDMEIKLEPMVFSQMLCEEAAEYDTELFFSPAENCQSDLYDFLTNFEKSGEFNASGSVQNGPDGKPVITISVGVGIKW